jgi:hypothetical protein
VPVVYCYMDDLAQWLKRLFVGKPHADANHSQTPPKIDALPRSAE